MDWLDLLPVQRIHKSLLQHHSSKASILWRSAFFIVQLSYPYMTTGKTIALTRWTCIGKVMSLLLNMLCWLVITFLPRSKRLLISWLQSPSAVDLDKLFLGYLWICVACYPSNSFPLYSPKLLFSVYSSSVEQCMCAQSSTVSDSLRPHRL